MIVSFDEISDDARIWIYQSNKSFSINQIKIIENRIKDFLNSWTSHGEKLKVASKIKYCYFIIIALDQNISLASGCSIDKMVHFIKNLENEFGVRLLDLHDISYKINNEIFVAKLKDFKDKILKKKIDNTTIVFNNLINLKSDLVNNWEIPLSKSWHKQLIK